MYLIYVPYTITLYDKIKISRYEYTTKLDGSHNIYSQVIEKIDQNIHWKNPVWLQKLHCETGSTIWRRVIHGRIWSDGLILIFTAHIIHERILKGLLAHTRDNPNTTSDISYLDR